MEPPSVWLQKTRQVNIVATNVILMSSSQLGCSFALPLDAATGAWDVCVKNPDGQVGALPGGFTVTKGASIYWYFAEGTTRPGFDCYYTIQNPGGGTADVMLTYLRGSGAPKNQTVRVPATSRATVHPADVLGAGNGPAYDFSTIVTCTNGKQVVAERPMYFDYAGAGADGWDGGSDVLGATGSSKTWYFAEGTCRPSFDTYFCLLNPVDKTAHVTLTLARMRKGK